MIGLKKGRSICGKFKAGNKLGFGIMYLLDNGISFEISSKGLALELGYEEVTLVQDIGKNTVLICWLEGDAKCQSKFRTKDAGMAEEIVKLQGKHGIAIQSGNVSESSDADSRHHQAA